MIKASAHFMTPKFICKYRLRIKKKKNTKNAGEKEEEELGGIACNLIG
jgi:hypothetical protein